MATCQIDLKKVANAVLTILKQNGWMSVVEMQTKLAERGTNASLADIQRIFDAIRTIYKLITDYGLPLEPPLQSKQ